MEKLKSRSAKTPVTRANGDQTKEKILDAAEELFGEHGFDTVSLRDITNLAGVTLALASYHFGTKDNLFSMVVSRRVDVLNHMRIERLKALEESGMITVESLIDAFMQPLFEQMKTGGDGWRAYVKVIAKLGTSNRWLELLKVNFDPTANLFIARFKLLMPGMPEESLVRGFSYMLQLMLQTVSQHRRVDSLSSGKYPASDLDKSYATLLKFTTAGMIGLSHD